MLTSCAWLAQAVTLPSRRLSAVPLRVDSIIVYSGWDGLISACVLFFFYWLYPPYNLRFFSPSVSIFILFLQLSLKPGFPAGIALYV